MATFANKFKDLRAEFGMSQDKMGAFLEIPPMTIRGWEAGRRKPSWLNLLQICEKTKKSLAYFDGCTLEAESAKSESPRALKIRANRLEREVEALREKLEKKGKK